MTSNNLTWGRGDFIVCGNAAGGVGLLSAGGVGGGGGGGGRGGGRGGVGGGGWGGVGGLGGGWVGGGGGVGYRGTIKTGPKTIQVFNTASGTNISGIYAVGGRTMWRKFWSCRTGAAYF